MHNENGFTLMELIVTVAITAIVATIGFPAFQETINNNRLTSTANALVVSMNLARAEAIKRGVRVTLCKSADGNVCAATGGYEQGWIVFADLNANATVPDPQSILQVNEALPGGLTLAGDTDVADFISYTPSGVSLLLNGGLQAGTLALCKPGYATSARQVILWNGGRVQIQRFEPASGAGCS